MTYPTQSHGMRWAGDRSNGPSARRGNVRAPGAMVRSATVLIRRAAAAADGILARIAHWQSVSRTIERLSTLNDAALRRKGLERSDIVAAVYQAAEAERAKKNPSPDMRGRGRSGGS